MRRTPIVLSVAFLIAALPACGDDSSTPDAGSHPADAATDAPIGSADAATDAPIGSADAATDAPIGSADAAVDAASMIDAAMIDAALIDAALIDATVPAIDAAPAIDAIPSDAAPDSSGQIGAVRGAADGAVDLPVQAAIVTYVAPLIGTDPAGFFVQAEQAGPALFVAVDPATLTPTPAAGQQVSFRVSAKTTVASQPRATAITGWQVEATGVPVAPLTQDVSAANDLVTNLDDYDSELVRLTATIAGPFASSATAHVAAPIDTAGVVGDASLRFRLPTTLQQSFDLAPGCVVTLPGTPLWRFNTTSEPSAWVASDVNVQSCPAPRVVSAVATSATTVVVTFDRVIDPASITADGSQFTFDAGLTATAAAAASKTVTVTTDMQIASMMYTVTVDSGVTDLYGTGVDLTNNSATFLGFLTPATLAINEVNPSIAGGGDLIELLVTSGGTLSGMKVVQGVGTQTVVANLPDLVVSTGDLIVVHVNATAAVSTETTTKTACLDVTCFAGAWDVAGANIGASGLTFSSRVLAVILPGGSIQTAVPFSNGTSQAAFFTDLQTIQGLGLWLPADCGGALCTGTSTPTGQAISAQWNAIGTTSSVAGNSAQRTLGQFTKTLADWTVTAPTWGAPNL